MKKRILAFVLVLSILVTILTGTFVVSAKTVSESEDNNSTSTADSVTLGDTVTGVISSGSDADYYKYTVSKNGYLSINFSNPILTESNAKWSIYVYRYSNSLEEIHTQSLSGKSASKDLPRIGVTPGTYYIKIVNGYSSNCYVTNVEYSVKAVFTASEYWESESNNSYTTADKINAGSTYNGYIRNGDDADYYELTVSQNGYLSINFSNAILTETNAKWSIYVYKYSISLEEIHTQSLSGKSASKDLPRIGVTPGTYYIKIVNGYSSNCYVTNVEYSVKAVFTASEYWESEGNNSYTSADVTAIGSKYSGYIRNGDDSDFYKFNISSSGYIDIRFENELITDNSNAVWKVILYNYNNTLTEIVSFKPLASNTSTVKQDIEVTEGTYYIKIVNGYSSNCYVTNKEYSITVIPDDTIKPTVSISSTNDVASTQTVKLNLKDNMGVVAYYCGTSSSPSSSSYTTISSTTSISLTKTVSSSGTYYLFAKDAADNVSVGASATFYKTTLNANGGSVSLSSVLTKSGNSVTLPTPQRDGYTFIGWGTSSTSTSGIISITPTSNKTYYAVWELILEPEPDVDIGDVNGDGVVDAGDAVLISRYDAGFITLTEEQLAAGDVNGDGTVDAGDAVVISRYDAGFISSLK